MLFPKNEKFLYLREQWGKGNYFLNLHKELRLARTVYGFALDGLEANSGFCSISDFNVISGGAIQRKRQLSPRHILDNLLKSKLVKKDSLCDDLITIYSNYSSRKSGYLDYKIQQIKKELILKGFQLWARNLCFVSYNRVAIRLNDVEPKFSGFHWHCTGPSYISPFINGEGYHGFFVGDVLCQNEVQAIHMQYFLRKIQMIKCTKSWPFIPVLIAEKFAQDAFKIGKQYGIIMATVENLFGKTIFLALLELTRTWKKMATKVTQNPEEIEKLFKKLSAINGADLNLPGALFELIVAHIVRTDGCEIEMGKMYRDGEKKTEVDVYKKEGNEIFFYECKGMKVTKAFNKKDAEKWIKNINLIYNLINEHDRRNHRLIFELWITGDFRAGVKEYIKEQPISQDVKLVLNNGQKVREIARKKQNKSISNMLNQHFFNKPR